MNRRSLLKLLPAAVTGLVLGSIVSRTADASEGKRIAWHSYARAHREELRAVTNKIIKESADMWMSVSGYQYRQSAHGAVLVTLYGNLARKITFESGRVIQKEITLGEKQREELRRYKDELDPRISQRIGVEFGNGWRLRAWIYNGRHPDEWIMSGEKIAA